MKLVEQKDKLNIENVDVQIIKKPSRHGPLLPDSIRGIFVGPSGSGKTNVMNNLITNKKGLNLKTFIYTLKHRTKKNMYY